MKSLLLLLACVGATLGAVRILEARTPGYCQPYGTCTHCSNCKYCGACNKEKNTCSVCDKTKR